MTDAAGRGRSPAGLGTNGAPRRAQMAGVDGDGRLDLDSLQLDERVKVVAFTHHVETELDLLREGRLSLSPAMSTLLLRCKDEILDLLAYVLSGGNKEHAMFAK